jgi:hypothetical protein
MLYRVSLRTAGHTLETEMMMSKTNDTSKADDAKRENRVLADSELDAVTGGRSSLKPSGVQISPSQQKVLVGP